MKFAAIFLVLAAIVAAVLLFVFHGSLAPGIQIGQFSGTGTVANNYDKTVLADKPVGFWNLDPTSTTESDMSGNGNDGTYEGGLPSAIAMPNGDMAADFNGTSEYLTIPSSNAYSIPTTGNLTWEAWIRPDVLEFPRSSDTDYVDFMGKCDKYGPTCEWEGRMYDTTTVQTNRSNRISAYAFNPTAGLGSGADWQPATSTIKTGQWIYVVGEYTLHSQPSDCPATSTYPGSINIWVDGVEWNQSYHSSTGCMSQYNIVPKANDSPLTVGTMAFDTWFKGAIGKVAIYNYLLSPETIAAHYQAMTGNEPTGFCLYSCTL